MRTVAWDIWPGGTTCGANERSMRTREWPAKTKIAENSTSASSRPVT